MLGEVLKRMDTTAALAPEGPNARAGVAPGPTGAETTATASQISQDDWDVLNARVDEQRQTKVESGAKFRLKLSGIALFNAFDTKGRADNLDLPAIAVPRFTGAPSGRVGGCARRAIIRLQHHRV